VCSEPVTVIIRDQKDLEQLLKTDVKKLSGNNSEHSDCQDTYCSGILHIFQYVSSLSSLSPESRIVIQITFLTLTQTLYVFKLIVPRTWNHLDTGYHIRLSLPVSSNSGLGLCMNG
jgi:hypothetical protein